MNFIIESGTFNAFLLEEAMQLTNSTLYCARKVLDDWAYRQFYNIAKNEIMNPLMKNYMDQEWTIAFGSDMWRQVFENGLQEFDKLKSFGS